MNVEIFKISGQTDTGKYVKAGFCTTLEFLVYWFYTDYPKFKGEAYLEWQICDEENETIYQNPLKWQVLGTFRTVGQLKQLVERILKEKAINE